MKKLKNNVTIDKTLSNLNSNSIKSFIIESTLSNKTLSQIEQKILGYVRTKMNMLTSVKIVLIDALYDIEENY